MSHQRRWIGSRYGARVPADHVITLDRLREHAAKVSDPANVDASLARVPRIIHHTYKTAEVPSRWDNSYQSWRRLQTLTVHPRRRWRLEFWTDERARDLIAERYEWFLPTYDAYPYAIQRADVLRYFVLHAFGGVYADLDIGLRRPADLEGLLAFGLVLPETHPVGFSNDFLVAAKGHPFLRQLIDQLRPQAYSRLGLPYLTIMMSTGPLFVGLQLANSADRADVFMLDGEVYAGHNSDALLFHVTGNSWHAWDAGYILSVWDALRGPYGGLALGFLCLLCLGAWAARRRPCCELEPRPCRWAPWR